MIVIVEVIMHFVLVIARQTTQADCQNISVGKLSGNTNLATGVRRGKMTQNSNRTNKRHVKTINARLQDKS